MAILKVIPNESRSLAGMLEYVRDADKVLYYDGILILDLNDPLKEFWLTKWAYGKPYGRQYKQIILSFTTEESREIPVDLFIRVVKEAAIVLAANTSVQMVYALHGNTDNVHVHFLLNSVSPWTGKKLQITNKILLQMKLGINRVLCRYGLQKIRLRLFEQQLMQATRSSYV